MPEYDKPVPIGRPCKGAEVALLGEDGLPVSSGQTGELCIAGPCLAKGYLNDPELTEKNFTAPPPGCALRDRIYWTGDLVRQTPDGDYVFVSRKDHQVKWMGYRIELAEIESNLQAHPQIKDAVTLLVPSGNGDLTELAAFYEADGQLDSAGLNRFLRERLPAYMIPKLYFKVQALPRNDRGKIARADILKLYLSRHPRDGDGRGADPFSLLEWAKDLGGTCPFLDFHTHPSMSSPTKPIINRAGEVAGLFQTNTSAPYRPPSCKAATVLPGSPAGQDGAVQGRALLLASRFTYAHTGPEFFMVSPGFGRDRGRSSSACCLPPWSR